MWRLRSDRNEIIGVMRVSQFQARMTGGACWRCAQIDKEMDGLTRDQKWKQI